MVHDGSMTRMVPVEEAEFWCTTTRVAMSSGWGGSRALASVGAMVERARARAMASSWWGGKDLPGVLVSGFIGGWA